MVEDEPTIRMLVTEEFTAAGFEVCEAATGDEAAALIQKFPTSFSLLVTDVHMPGQRDGIEVARLFRRQHEHNPVIYTTGRPDVISRHVMLGQCDALLEKPFLLSRLMRVARRLLEKISQ